MSRAGKVSLCSVILFCSFSVLSLAHSGRTNSKGCHIDRKTGQYHCHRKKNNSSQNQKNKPPKSLIDTYDRTQYIGGWIDIDDDCQTTREEVLLEESLIPVTFETAKHCKVVSGRWFDPYTGKIFTDPRKLDIDHVVPLKEAHVSGGYRWTLQKKRKYANWLENKNHLIAVSALVNQKKGARDPAHWLPPNKLYHREYALIWLAIKKEWKLSIDSAEMKTLKKILETH
jgi:hypothetical protein